MSERTTLESTLESEDWARYAAPAADVRRRGEIGRRRRRSTAFGSLALVAALVAALPVLHSVRDGHAAPTKAPTNWPTPTPQSFGPPHLAKAPWTVIKSGVDGEGKVNGHYWQLAYEVLPSQSKDNDQPIVTCMDFTVDTTSVRSTCDEGDTSITDYGGFGVVYQPGSYDASDLKVPIVVCYSRGTPGTKSVTLVWSDGRMQAVPVPGRNGTGRSAFAFDPLDPPHAVVESGTYGTKTIPIAGNGTQVWMPGTRTDVTPPATPAVHTPSGSPHLSAQHAKGALATGILGQGAVDGHSWEASYSMHPGDSGSTAPDKVYFCVDDTIDGKTSHGMCMGDIPAAPDGRFTFSAGAPTRSVSYGSEPPPALLVAPVFVDPGTTSVGLEWPDGTTSVTSTVQVGGKTAAAVAFSAKHAPSAVLEFGSFGEYRIPLTESDDIGWEFVWGPMGPLSPPNP